MTIETSTPPWTFFQKLGWCAPLVFLPIGNPAPHPLTVKRKFLLMDFNFGCFP